MAKIVEINPINPQARLIEQVVEVLRFGGVICYPTDTMYGIGCDITQAQAIEKICQIKNVQPKKAHLSFICKDLSEISDYAKNISTPIFRTLKTHLPGPYTFILEASKQVPKLLQTKKDTVGIRVPDNKICQMIVAALGNPLMTTSLPMDEDVEYFTDPEVMNEIFGNMVDYVIDGGIGGIVSSTIIDCTSGTPELVRLGAGEWDEE